MVSAVGRGADGLQIAAGAEGAAFALDHQHPDVVIGLDLGAELLELLARSTGRSELKAAGRLSVMVRDRAFDPEQRRIVGSGGGMHRMSALRRPRSERLAGI